MAVRQAYRLLGFRGDQCPEEGIAVAVGMDAVTGRLSGDPNLEKAPQWSRVHQADFIVVALDESENGALDLV